MTVMGRAVATVTSPIPIRLRSVRESAELIRSIRRPCLRAGWGLTYAQAPNFNYIGGGNSLGMGFNNISFTNATFGAPALQLSNGLSYDPSTLYAATYATGIRPDPGQIDNPPALVDRNGGRPPRENQWNISLQRELLKDLVVEAAYVGNRGVWEQANGLVNLNALTPQRIAQFGLER